mmetsp:Transcript_1384/g.4239  ORF Transcript_1384/g.4239 Transcript_1384/m.4239 type:complete len:110 (+) Transcript_1384:878-1207(+)
MENLLLSTKDLLLDGLLGSLRKNKPFARAVGLDKVATGEQLPPGRNFILEPFKLSSTEVEWNVREAQYEDLNKIVLCSSMLSDHNVASYLDAVIKSQLRHTRSCRRFEL